MQAVLSILIALLGVFIAGTQLQKWDRNKDEERPNFNAALLLSASCFLCSIIGIYALLTGGSPLSGFFPVNG